MIKPGGRGKAFEALVVYSFNSSENSYAVRLRESLKGAFCLKCHNYINLSNKSRQQPFDYIVVHNGRPFALEAKSVHGVSFPFRNIKDHQIYHLEAFEKHGSAHVLIEFIPGKNRPRKHFLIPIAVFKEIADYYNNKRESLPMSKLEEYASHEKALLVNYRKNEKKKFVLDISECLEKALVQRWSN